MKRFYISDAVGAGTEDDPFRPAALDHGTCRECIELGNQMLVWVDDAEPQHAQHADLAADSRITFIPFVDLVDNPLPPSAQLVQISPANRAKIREWLEARNVPIGDLKGTDTIATLLRRVVKRWRIRGALRQDNITESLDLTLADIPAAKRQRINDKLTARGYDTGFASGQMTIREFMRNLGEQDRGFVYIGADD